MGLFGRKKTTGNGAGIDPQEFLSQFLTYHSDTEAMKEDARRSDRPVAILKPQIPLGQGHAAGWFGGRPKLPHGVDWPTVDGQLLPFVCQLDLSALPRQIWGGIGPREGWLAIFLSAKCAQLRILHVDGALTEREGPGQESAVWTSNTNWKSPRIFDLPRWPVTIDERPGTALHEPADPQAASSDQTLLDSTAPALADPAYLPFDQDTLILLTEAIASQLVKQARGACHWSRRDRLRDADRLWFERQKPIAMQSLQRYFEREAVLRASSVFAIDAVVEVMREVANLPTYEFSYDRDEEGHRVVRHRQSKLSEAPQLASYAPLWWSEFQRVLQWHAVIAYTRDPSSLHPALRARMECVWRAQTSRHFAAMGHAPVGHIYTPHGPATPNEVLLELPTSNLTGWIWGDCYSLVLTIEREALRKADFSNVAMDITN